MRIHTTLTPADFYDAVRAVNEICAQIKYDVAPNSHRDHFRPHTVTPVDMERCEVHGSRTHARGIDVALSGDATNRTNSGSYGAGESFAASYDQWGLFLAELYARDESIRVPQIYHDAEHFHWATGSRYRREIWTPTSYHRRHGWQPQGTAVTGAYHVSECRADACAAITRRVALGRDWSEISE